MPRDDSPYYEPDASIERDNSPRCAVCGHRLTWHGPQGCEGNKRVVRLAGAVELSLPCGCEEWRRDA
jgi:hypothetical protein